MNRILVRTASVAFGALLTAGCATAGTAASAPTAKTASATPPAATAPAATPSDDAATPAASLAANLDSEIVVAQQQRAKGDLQGASQTLAQLMLVAPDDARVVGEYGKVLAERGKSDDAIAFLERAVELQPDDWTLYSALGVAYDEANQRANAKLAYQHALTLKPGEPVVLNNMAVSAMQAGDYDGAQKLLQQASAAGGDVDPKISHNLAKLADLEAAHPAKVAAQPVTPPPATTARPEPKPAPVSVATLAPPPVATPKGSEDTQAASHAPAKLAADPHSKDKAQTPPQSGTPSLRTAAD